MEHRHAVASSDTFDVIARIPSGLRLEDIQRRGEEAGIKAETLRALLNALRNVPHVQIGKAVSRPRADAAQALYARSGLEINITPVLALESKRTADQIACPSCREHVVLTDKRQCPKCLVFVDKFTDEYLEMLRRAELERASRRKELENEFQLKLDTAVYEMLKKQGVFKGRAGAGRGVALIVFLAAAFVIGRGTLGGWNVDTLLSAGFRPNSSQQLMAKAWPGGERATGGAAGVAGAAGAAGAAGVDAGAGATGGGGAPEAGEALDADLDDPLIQQAGGKRIGAKGISIEQAVAASRMLAKSVGNTTAERALADAGEAGPPGGARAPGVDPDALGATPSAAAAPRQAPATASAAPGSPAAQPQAVAQMPAPVPVPAPLKVSLGIDLARQLAEMGQVGRATRIANSMAPRATGSPGLPAQSQAANIEIRAWGLGAMEPSRARAMTQQLFAEADRIADAPTRVLALTQAAIAIAHQAQLPKEAARAYIARAGEILPSVNEEARESSTAAWAAGLGTVMLNECLVAARAGRWAQVRTTAGHLQTVAQQAPASAQARLLAIASQVQSMLGNSAAAGTALDAALVIAKTQGGVAARAATLRSIAAGAGLMGDKVNAAAEALQAQVQGLGTSPAERAQALLELSFMNAENGSRSRASEIGQAARRVPGLAGADLLAVETELIVRSDLIGAQLLHASGLYGEAEALVRKVGAYVL